MRKIYIIGLGCFVITVIITIIFDSNFLRNIYGNGLPNDPNQALTKAISLLNKSNTEAKTAGIIEYYNDQGNLSIEFAGKTNTIQKNSFSKLEFKTVKNNLIDSLPSQFKGNMAIIDEEIYFNIELSDSWYKLSNLKYILNEETIKNTNNYTEEKIDSKSFRKYKSTLNFKNYLGIQDNYNAEGIFLIDPKKISIKRSLINISPQNLSISGIKFIKEDEFLNYKSTNAISAPTESIEAELTLENIGFILRDQIRKKDISIIQAALEKYYSDKGAYPVITTISNEPDFMYFLKESYLSDIPKDPKLDYYYEYKGISNNEYQLTCVLENKYDNSGEQKNNYNVYKLTNQRKE